MLIITDKLTVDRRRVYLRINLKSDTPNHHPDSFPSEKKKKGEKRAILCQVCFARITSSQEEVSRNGRHTHVFFNPTGIVFETRCFSHAPGCEIHGSITSQFSWFSGYRWQYGFCTTCLTHLGWWFSNRDDGFFSLIVNRLID